MDRMSITDSFTLCVVLLLCRVLRETLEALWTGMEWCDWAEIELQVWIAR